MTRSAAGRHVVVALLLVTGHATAAAAQPAPPTLRAPVNDFADVMDPGTRSEIDALVRRLQTATSDVMVITTVKTFAPWADLPSYAVRMFENGGSGIGAKGKDNGVLIVLAVDDRQVRVEVGYDLEAFITDGFAGEVSRDVMVPFFRSGNFGQGLLAGATDIALRIAQGRNVDLGITAVPPAPKRDVEFRIPGAFWIILAIILLLGRGGGGRRRSRWASGAGVFGAGGFGGGWSSSGGSGGSFGGFGGGRSGGGGGGASW